MIFEQLELNGLILINPSVFEDERGFFYESFHQGKYKINGVDIRIVQQNHSGSKKNILRGLHYQIHNSQGKLVRVLKGEIFDVAVDLRKSSPTFGQWEGKLLNEINRSLLWIPQGFAHGFLVMSDWAEVEYSTTDFYDPRSERTLLWNDPDLKINWPLAKSILPILSVKDQNGTSLKESELYE
jgi:dTDP-4-dehydrorhamnose 3,5-epimerase